jgi:hypothetical protein
VYVSVEMAAPLRRSLPSLGRALLTPAVAPARMLSAEASDALVEIKPGEIGMVSGIPEEHLRRKVTCCILLSRVFSCEMVDGVDDRGRLERDLFWSQYGHTGELGLDHCVGCDQSLGWIEIENRRFVLLSIGLKLNL